MKNKIHTVSATVVVIFKIKRIVKDTVRNDLRKGLLCWVGLNVIKGNPNTIDGWITYPHLYPPKDLLKKIKEGLTEEDLKLISRIEIISRNDKVVWE